MKYLITGGQGFIGYHLAKELVLLGNDVTIIDNLRTSNYKNNFRHKFIEANIVDYPGIDDLVAGVDFVVHLAAIVGMKNGFDYPYESVNENVNATKLIAELCIKHNKELFFASTSEIYGMNTLVPLAEDAPRVVGPTWDLRWGYSESKAISERTLILSHKAHGLNVKIGRFFNVAGPNQTGKYGMVLPRFVGAAMRNNDLVVYGDGTQTRSFCHVSDAVKAIMSVITYGKPGEVYNIGNDEEISIMDLAKRVIAKTLSKSKIVTAPYDSVYPGYTEISRRVPDIDKILGIGWKPIHNLDKIILDIFANERVNNVSNN